MKRNLLLALVIGLIILTIIYLDSLKTSSTDSAGPAAGISDPYRELAAPSGFINTDAFTLGDFIGKKVILIDFWTYSCINCQRTTPYLNAWWDKYKDEGLLIVGVHSPEFEFEKVLANVQSAVEEMGIKFPVVLDNDKGTWNAYGNRYWPRKYLIDLNGNIAYDHIGEGGYEETEMKIQELLGLKEGLAAEDMVSSTDFGRIRSPEVYFGSERNTLLGNGAVHKEPFFEVFETPETLEPNKLYLDGEWMFGTEFAQSRGEAAVLFPYSAKNVYMVASAPEPTEVEVWVDGQLSQTLTISGEKLYTLVAGEEYDSKTLELRMKNSVKFFTLSFG